MDPSASQRPVNLLPRFSLQPGRKGSQVFFILLVIVRASSPSSSSSSAAPLFAV